MNRQISKGVLLSFIAQGIAILVNLVYTPLMIRVLGQNEYGLYQLVQSVVNYLNLMNFGFTGAYVSFYARERVKENGEEAVARLNGMFLRIFLAIALVCLLAGGLLLRNIRLLGTRVTEAEYATARQLMLLMVLNLAVSFPNSVFTVYIAAKDFHVVRPCSGKPNVPGSVERENAIVLEKDERFPRKRKHVGFAAFCHQRPTLLLHVTEAIGIVE